MNGSCDFARRDQEFRTAFRNSFSCADDRTQPFNEGDPFPIHTSSALLLALPPPARYNAVDALSSFLVAFYFSGELA